MLLACCTRQASYTSRGFYFQPGFKAVQTFMKLAVLFSGGKDSNYALYWALNQGFDVTHLVAIIPKKDDSYMFHVPCIGYTRLQAESIGIPLIQQEVSGVKEKEVSELECVLARLDIDGIVSGAVASEYQKTRLDSICENLKLRSYAPLWHKNQGQLLRDMINAGFKVMMVGIAAEGLDEGWLGRILTLEDVEKLEEIGRRHKINVSGEGGEYETFVLDGPIYKRPISIIESARRMTAKNAGTLEILKAELA
jgi:diphthine-ammonia ligase